ncbi:MAG: hypothetical protein DELT_03182 [Desulfovibrio sp.]
MRIFRVEFRFDPRPERAEGIKALTPRPLIARHLQVARRHIVQAGIAKNIVRRIPAPDFPAFPFHDKSQLCLVIQLFADVRFNNRPFRVEDRADPFGKNQRFLPQLHFDFLGMAPVIEAYRHNVPGFAGHCQRALRKRQFFAAVFYFFIGGFAQQQGFFAPYLRIKNSLFCFYSR